MSLIPKEVPKNKRWRVYVNGVELIDVDMVEIKSEYGNLTYGQRSEGYNGLAFAPFGGAIILPYVIQPEGEILVGLIKEERPNMGEEPVWCGIGGCRDKGETHHEAAIREFIEETGFAEVSHCEELIGLPINPDRLFYVADFRKGEGVRAYCVRILDGEIEKDGDSFKFKDSVLIPGFKKVNEVRFFTYREAARITADGLALAALTQFKISIG